MDQQIIFGDPVLTNSYNLRMRAVHANALVAVFPEDHWLAVLEIEHAVIAHAAFGKRIKRVIVEDIAVLVDLDKRDALVFRRGLYHRTQMFDVDIDRTRDKRRLAGNRQRKRIDRIVDGADRS